MNRYFRTRKTLFLPNTNNLIYMIAGTVLSLEEVKEVIDKYNLNAEDMLSYFVEISEVKE